MAATFIASAIGTTGASGTSLATSTSLNVATADILLCWSTFTGAATTNAVSDGGSNAMTMETNTVNTAAGALGYKLVGVANATATFTQTLGAARAFREIIVFQFRPDAGETIARDAANTGSGSGAAASTSNITTGGAGTVDVIVVAGALTAAVDGATVMKINAVAATGSVANQSAMWYRILTANFTGGNATATVTSDDWVCQILSIKSDAAAAEMIPYHPWTQRAPILAQ